MNYLSAKIFEMTKDEFIKLSIPEKIDLIWAEGEFISQKVYYENNINLVLMDNFLVEVFLNRSSNEIEGIEIQENHQILFEYVKDLELNELFNKKE